MNNGKNIVMNVARGVARSWGNQGGIREMILTDPIWISISEPGRPNSQVVNTILDNTTHLKIDFWDITSEMTHEGELLLPPTKDDAKKIVDFIMSNPNRDILVNCAAGISRSSAICQFCEDVLHYKWGMGKNVARPNSLLYRFMVNYHCELLGDD